MLRYEDRLIIRAHVKTHTPCNCLTCNSVVTPTCKDNWFDDEISFKEFGISGMCQDCQDGVFDTTFDEPN